MHVIATLCYKYRISITNYELQFLKIVFVIQNLLRVPTKVVQSTLQNFKISKQMYSKLRQPEFHCINLHGSKHVDILVLLVLILMFPNTVTSLFCWSWSWCFQTVTSWFCSSWSLCFQTVTSWFFLSWSSCLPKLWHPHKHCASTVKC